MSDYILIYHGGPKFASREEGAAYMAKWKEWIDGLGDAVVNRGVPFGKTVIVGLDGAKAGDGASGYTVLRADNIEEAVEMVKPCPHTEFGTIEVSEAMDMSM